MPGGDNIVDGHSVWFSIEDRQICDYTINHIDGCSPPEPFMDDYGNEVYDPNWWYCCVDIACEGEPLLLSLAMGNIDAKYGDQYDPEAPKFWETLEDGCYECLIEYSWTDIHYPSSPWGGEEWDFEFIWRLHGEPKRKDC
jgi:hypothetical protein